MKKTLIALMTVAVTGFTGAAMADPVALTDDQMNNIVAGAAADWDIYINKGGQFAAVPAGTAAKRNWSPWVATISCDDAGAGTCSYGGKDFVWDAISMEWED